MSGKWFTGVEEVVYSAVEYIPLVGTVYSFKRAGFAYGEGDWKRHWQSLANFAESAIRDVILFYDIAEPQTAVIIHTMAEALSDSIIGKFFDEDARTPRIQVTKPLDSSFGHVLVAGLSEEKCTTEAEKLFKNKAKGLHHFHGAVFNGIITHPVYAPNGQKIQLSLPQGFYDNAPCQFMWRWTIDPKGVPNKPVFTLGRLKINPEEGPGQHTRFVLSTKRGVDWEGHDFRGDITGKDTLSVTASIDDMEVSFSMTRRQDT